MSFLEYEQVLRHKKLYNHKDDAPTYVYFLIKDDVIVYVGRTTNLRNRLKMHQKNKSFDSYYHIETTVEKAKELELQYIARFQPEYNKNFDGCNYVSLDELQKEFGVDVEVIQSVLRKLETWNGRYPSQMAKNNLADYIQSEFEKTEEFKNLEKGRKKHSDLELKKKIDAIFESDF